MEKYLVRLHEVALYEVYADSKEEAEELVFEKSLGDFIGYADNLETVVDCTLIKEEDSYAH